MVSRQKYGIDYDETFAPVAKLAIVRSLLVVASLEGWIVHQMNVKNAFLHGDLKETVYMKLPPGYTHIGSRIKVQAQGEKLKNTADNTMVCKLKKSLCGLNQAPRKCFSKLSSALKSNEFIQFRSDVLLSQNKMGRVSLAFSYMYMT